MDKTKKYAPIVRGQVAEAISANVVRYESRIKNIVAEHRNDHVSHPGEVWVNGAFYCSETTWVHMLKVNPL